MRCRFRFSAFFLCLLLALAAVPFAACADDLPSNYSEALKYVKSNQPMEAVAAGVSWNPKQLSELRDALPEGAVFHFSCKWNGMEFSDESEELDLTKVKENVGDTSIRRLLSLCPHVKYVNNATRKYPSNDVFIPLMEDYPDIHFEWIVHLRGEHYCPTGATAYSTLNHTDYGTRLKDADLELLQYVPGLKALDVGHNTFTDLKFLRFFPDLELLIISNNDRFEDLSAIGELKHLKYLEVHNTRVSDLSPLANCTELLDLNISSTRVADLSPLDGITTLDRLWANAARKLPAAEQARFTELHPDCTADFTLNGSAISHHWREHERYYHYRDCFMKNVWIPFGEN